MAQSKSPKKRQRKTFEERCKQVYDFFMDFYYENGMSPTYSEMSKGTGIRRGNLYTYVEMLIEDHKIVKKIDKAHTTAKKGDKKTNFPRVLLPAQLPQGSYPLHWVGHVAANSLNPLVVLDLLDSDSTIEVPKHLLPPKSNVKDLYILQVNGDSMTGANISDGDYVVMQSGNIHRDGDIVAAYLKSDGAVTLKVFKQTERGNVKLQPKSHKHAARIEKIDDVEIQGRVVAVMRKY